MCFHMTKRTAAQMRLYSIVHGKRNGPDDVRRRDMIWLLELLRLSHRLICRRAGEGARESVRP